MLLGPQSTYTSEYKLFQIILKAQSKFNAKYICICMSVYSGKEK